MATAKKTATKTTTKGGSTASKKTTSTEVAASRAKADLAAADVNLDDWYSRIGVDTKSLAAKIQEIYGKVPSGTYKPTLLDPRQIAGLYEQNPLVTTEGLQQQLAADRAAALESQIAALDTRYKDSLGQVESAYGAVNQLLGAAQQDFTKGYNPIVASQAGVNAETAAAMQQAQQEVAARLASTGSTSVGGGQSAAVGTQVAAEAAATGAAQSDLLIGQGGAMQSYMTGMAPQLASLARAGAIQGLGSARINAEAQARAAAAQAALEDRRALALQDIQMRNQRAGDIINTMGNVMTTNMSARNQAAASNAQAAQQLALAKAKLEADVFANQQKIGAAGYQSLSKLNSAVSQFVTESGGKGAEAIFNQDRSGKVLGEKERLMNPDGSINYDNFQAWSDKTQRDESYLMAYLAAQRVRGQANDNDFANAIDAAALMRAQRSAAGADEKQKSANANKLFETYRKEYKEKWGSFGVSSEPQVNQAISSYLNTAMASAFNPYYMAPTGPQGNGIMDRIAGFVRSTPGQVVLGGSALTSFPSVAAPIVAPAVVNWVRSRFQ